MAIAECSVDYSATRYCGTTSYLDTRAYLDGVDFWRDTGNASQAILHCAVNASAHFGWVQWLITSGYVQIGARVWADGTGSQNDQVSQQGKGPAGCREAWYWLGNRTIDVYSNSSTYNLHVHAGWEFDASIYSPSHAGNGWFGYCNYALPDDKRITPPQNLNATWPSPLGKLEGVTTATISGWGKANNMTGTPTNYPGAEYRNWALDLMDKNGNYLAHYCLKQGEQKTATWNNPEFYTAEVLAGTAQANATKYPVAKNTPYKLRADAINSFVQWTTLLSGLLYSEPPTPSVSITSIVYQPSSKDCTLTFTWSKPTDGGGLKESVYYSIYDAKGNYYKTDVLLQTNAAGVGAAMSGSITVTGLPSGEQYYVKVTVNQYRSDGTTVLDSASKTVDDYAPVANAAFLGFDWDELRRECTIRAEAPGAANCRIQAGYAPNVYDIGDKLTTGQVGTLVVKDLNHGSGQILYLQAVPEASNGHQYENEIAKISIPIPNPILGVHTPSCEKIEAGAEKEYIVDIIEKKKGSSTCTQRWQNGGKVVVKNKCLPVIPPEGGVSSGPVLPANNTVNIGTSNYIVEVGEETPAFTCSNSPSLIMRLQRPCYMALEIDWPAIFPDIDFTLSTTTVSSGSAGGYSPSVDGQKPLHKSTYNKTTHKSVVELGSPKPFTGVWKCWNTDSRINFSTANESFYVKVKLGGTSWSTTTNPQQFVSQIVVNRGGKETVLCGIKEETLHLTKTAS